MECEEFTRLNNHLTSDGDFTITQRDKKSREQCEAACLSLPPQRYCQAYMLTHSNSCSLIGYKLFKNDTNIHYRRICRKGKYCKYKYSYPKICIYIFPCKYWKVPHNCFCKCLEPEQFRSTSTNWEFQLRGIPTEKIAMLFGSRQNVGREPMQSWFVCRRHCHRCRRHRCCCRLWALLLTTCLVK